MDDKILKKAHEAALKKIDKKLPKMDVIDIIRTALAIAQEEDKLKAVKEIALKYKDPALEYVQTFGEHAINGYLKDSDNEFFTKLGKQKIGKELVKMSKDASSLVLEYMKGEINAEVLAEKLQDISTNQFTKKIINALDIDPKKVADHPEELMKLSSPVVAYNALSAAYKEYRKALDDLELAREQRIQIEAQCAESVKLIKAYREEINQRMSEYLTTHLEAFEEGLAMMDQAIADNDPDGYIRGNVELQKVMKYDVQFTTQEEFDELMDSDEAFKL